jgi:hypothetical protein
MNLRKIILPLALLLTLGLASTALAGGSIFAGANFPTGGFSDDAKTGWNAGGYYTFDLIPIVDLGILVDYSDFSYSPTLDPTAEDLWGGSINAWEFHALGQLSIGFLKGFLGLGAASHNLSGDNTTDFSWQLGIAAQIAMLEGRLGYHQIPGDDKSVNWVSLTIGLSF